METRVFLGQKPLPVKRDEAGRLTCQLPPQLELSMPVLFSAMSYGSISYNAHAALAGAAAHTRSRVLQYRRKGASMRISIAMEKIP